MVIWWIRRDVRLSDNAALHAALAADQGVVPLFIVDSHRLQFPAAKRHAFLYTGLRQLDSSLRARGSRLIVRQGDWASALREIAAETQATAIIAEETINPFARRRDAALAQDLPLRLTPGLTVHHPALVVKNDGSPYTVFTRFMHAWQSLPLPTESDLLPVPASLPPVPQNILSTGLPEANHVAAFPPGEAEAQRRLKAFTEGDNAGIRSYADERDRLDRAGTSELSPYLRFGMISARQAVVAALGAVPSHARGAETWLKELVWREFYQAILFHFPNVLSESLRSDLRAIEWNNGVDDYTAWCDGRTGYPVVDAAMRQLVQTGWMHNRARMIVASFLTKDLLVDWRWGERFFMEHLIDGDAAANNGGWQWTAGTGADAAPYFRIFNPILQALKFDPNGEFVRRWLPELERVPTRYIGEPWLMPDSVQEQAGCIIDRDYPAPIIDRTLTRPRTLAAYRVAQMQHV